MSFYERRLARLCKLGKRGGAYAAAAACGWFGGRYMCTREITPGTGVTLDDGLQEVVQPAVDWLYGVKSDE